jgi:hypothetical protein
MDSNGYFGDCPQADSGPDGNGLPGPANQADPVASPYQIFANFRKYLFFSSPASCLPSTSCRVFAPVSIPQPSAPKAQRSGIIRLVYGIPPQRSGILLLVFFLYRPRCAPLRPTSTPIQPDSAPISPHHVSTNALQTSASSVRPELTAEGSLVVAESKKAVVGARKRHEA